MAALLLLLVALPLAGFGVAAGLGYERAVVLTGSMAPTYPVGSITFIQPLDPFEVEQLQPGDPIMFWSPDDFTQSVTHRVVHVRADGLITKGDANDVADRWVVPRGAVLGLVRYHVPHLGFVTSMFQDRNTGIAAFGVAAALFILNEIAQIVRTVRTDRREKEKEAARVVSIRPPDLDAVALERQAA